METVQNSISALSEQIEVLQTQVEDASALAEEIQLHHQRLLSWADVYEAASVEEKKMVASYIIKAVTLKRGYEIQVEFNINEAQYLSGMGM